VSEIGYGREITDNVRGFIPVRLSSLRLGTTGRFFEGGHPIDFGKLMARNVVFQTGIAESHGDNYGLALALFGGTMAVIIVLWTLVGPERKNADFAAEANAPAR